MGSDFLYVKTDNPESINTHLPELSDKDEKDITKGLKNIIHNISTNGYAHFDGKSMEDLEEDDKDLSKSSLENSFRLAKQFKRKVHTEEI